jgi:hypothetical protein
MRGLIFFLLLEIAVPNVPILDAKRSLTELSMEPTLTLAYSPSLE